MATDLDLTPFVDATSGLLAAVLARHVEGEAIFQDARSGRTSLRVLYDHRQRHLVVAAMDERGFRPIASIDVGAGEMEFTPYAEPVREPAPVH